MYHLSVHVMAMLTTTVIMKNEDVKEFGWKESSQRKGGVVRTSPFNICMMIWMALGVARFIDSQCVWKHDDTDSYVFSILSKE